MKNSRDEDVYESKWGWHPCDAETYQMLRRCNYLRLLAWHQDAKHDRWARKHPRNRVRRPAIRDQYGRKTGYGETIPIPEPSLAHRELKLTTSGDGSVDIHKNYIRAKYPKSSPETVDALTKTKEQIREDLKILEDWFNKHGQSVEVSM